MRLDCLIADPEHVIYEGQVEFIVVTAIDGELGILPRHVPLLALLAPGIARITEGSEVQRFRLGAGLVQVVEDRAALLVEGGERLE